MSNIIEKVGEAVHRSRSKRNSHDLASVTKNLKEQKLWELKYVDLTIQFIGASGLPKMDVVGSADPYFVANLDEKVSLVSTVQPNTLSPVWNETWRVKNVPTTAQLSVQVYDKDNGAPIDDYVGKFSTTVSEGAKEVEIQAPALHIRKRGTFWLKIESKPSEDWAPNFPYLFDGPIRYSRHFSPTVGLFTNLNDARLYSTWKVYIIGVSLFFEDKHQHWNVNYKAAQSIFQGPTSAALRSTIQAGHRMLYSRSTRNSFGIISSVADIVDILHAGSEISYGNGHGGPQRELGELSALRKKVADRVKPAVYTYIISSEDDSFRFSETGAAFFVDFASKHALHSNCAETVRYSGEFHPRPKGGWDAFSDEIEDNEVEWELVIDNNSGTYSPDPELLPTLRALLEYNFAGFTIVALPHEDPELVASREACREYALRFRGVTQHELQPHIEAGEVTLMKHASAKASDKAEH